MGTQKSFRHLWKDFLVDGSNIWQEFKIRKTTQSYFEKVMLFYKKLCCLKHHTALNVFTVHSNPAKKQANRSHSTEVRKKRAGLFLPAIFLTSPSNNKSECERRRTTPLKSLETSISVSRDVINLIPQSNDLILRLKRIKKESVDQSLSSACAGGL